MGKAATSCPRSMTRRRIPGLLACLAVSMLSCAERDALIVTVRGLPDTDRVLQMRVTIGDERIDYDDITRSQKDETKDLDGSSRLSVQLRLPLRLNGAGMVTAQVLPEGWGQGSCTIAKGIAAVQLMDGSGTGDLTLQWGPPTQVTVSPASRQVVRGFSSKFTAQATYCGDVMKGALDVTSRASWTSSVSAVATAASGEGAGGTVDTLEPGETMVSANLGGTAGSARLTVRTLTTARLNKPQGLVVADDGTVYVADTGNNAIRKLTADGLTTLVADRPQSVIRAVLDQPQRIAIDRMGLLYVSDFSRFVIRIIDPLAGSLDTFGVLDQPGHREGNKDSALLSQPVGVAVDTEGVIYVAEFGSSVIRRIRNGQTATVAGPPLMDRPAGITLDQQGRLYVADGNNSRIQIVTPTGDVSTLSLDLPFSYPQDVVIDGTGTLYVVGKSPISRSNGTARVPLRDTAGQPLDDLMKNKFTDNYGVAIDKNGALYVTNVLTHSLWKLLPVRSQGDNGWKPVLLIGQLTNSGMGQEGAAGFADDP